MSTFINLLEIVYPVGSVYITSSSTSPATAFGGTWTQIKDRFPIACGSTYANGTTGGKATHTLTVAEMPQHKHRLRIGWGDDNGEWNTLNAATGAGSNWGSAGGFYYDESQVFGPGASAPTKGDQPHNNMPPYVAKYMWQRTA